MSHIQKAIHSDCHRSINDKSIKETGVFILANLDTYESTQLGAVIPANIAAEIYKLFSDQRTIIDSALHARNLIKTRWRVIFSDISETSKSPQLTTADGIYFCGENFLLCEYRKCGEWLESQSNNLQTARLQYNDNHSNESFMICFVY